MTFKTKLLATTAAALIATGSAVWADGHATHPVTGETLASEQSFSYSILDDSPRSTRSSLKMLKGPLSPVTSLKV